MGLLYTLMFIVGIAAIAVVVVALIKEYRK